MGKDIFLYCMKLMEILHDSMDLNIVAALMHLASNALLFLELEQAVSVAISYLLVGESTLEAKNATNSEVNLSFCE